MGKEKADLIHIAERFAIEGEIGSIEAHGNGHINDTFLVTCRLAEGKTRRYILQRMNQEVFKNPKELMENVTGVTTFLQNKPPIYRYICYRRRNTVYDGIFLIPASVVQDQLQPFCA